MIITVEDSGSGIEHAHLKENMLASLLGEAKGTFTNPKVTYSGPKVTHSDPSHLSLPPPASPGDNLTISQVKINVWWEGGSTKFSVSSRLGFKL